MRRLPLVAVVALASCAESDRPPCRGNEASVETTVKVPASSLPVRGDLAVSGSAEHLDGLAIRTIRVLGVPAENDGFNFDEWSATIPLSALLAAENTEGSVTLDVEITDACSKRKTISETSVTVDPEALSVVDSLVLEVRHPGAGNAAPANQKAFATLDITANAEAAGVSVTLSEKSGAVMLDGSNPKIVRLVEDPGGSAVAHVELRAATPGHYFITGTAKGRTDSDELSISGRPILSPSSAAIASGQAVRITVDVEGRGDVEVTCEAAFSDAASVSSGGIDLSLTPGGVDTNGDGLLDIDVQAIDAVTVEDTIAIRCSDVFGQTGSAEIEVVP